ncbi:hypothetical protein Tco_0359774 [Tanacetum coccineum]
MDASSVYTESSGTSSVKQKNNNNLGNECSKIGDEIRSGNESSYSRKESSNSGNDTDVDGANIRPTYDTDPMEKIHSSDMSHNEGKVYQDVVQEKERALLASLIDKMKLEIDESKKINKELKKENMSLFNELTWVVPKNQNFINLLEQQFKQVVDRTAINVKMFKQRLQEEMVEDLRFFNSLIKEVESLQSQLELQRTQFSNENDRILREYFYNDRMNAILVFISKLMNIRIWHANQPVVRQPTAFNSERSQISKSRFASQVVKKNALIKPITPHSWPKAREFVFAKPHHFIALGSSRYSSKTVSASSLEESVGSNDMVHNYYLEEAKKKA